MATIEGDCIQGNVADLGDLLLESMGSIMTGYF
jgi:hypothetical protein